LVLLIGIFLAVVAFVLILFVLQGNDTNNPTTGDRTKVTVVVAARDIALSTKVTSVDCTTQEIDQKDQPTDSYTDCAFVVGQTARQAITKGQLITSAMFATSGTNIQVPDGYVGVSLLVNQATGVGTLIKSGDYVDLVMGLTGEAVPLVQYVPAPTPKAGGTPAPNASGSLVTPADLGANVAYNPTTVKVLAEGLQVLGTLLPPPPANTGDNSGTTTGSATAVNPDQQELVIVAATVQQAEVIKFAQMQGDISLVLRATTDCQTAAGQPTPCPIIPTTGVTLRVLVDDYGVLPPQLVQVIQPSPLPNVLPSGHPAVVPSPSPSPSPSPAG
jgi:Flp pilus assembly protein CpaB